MGRDYLRVDRMLLPIAKVGVDCEDELGSRESGAFLEISRRGGVRDSDHASTREDHPQVDCNRLRRHRQVQGDAVARLRTDVRHPIRDPSGEAMQLAVRDAPKLRSRLGRVHDGGLSRFSAEAALGDVEARARQPMRGGWISGRFEDPFRLLAKHDAEAADHLRPEVLPMLRGPSVELWIGADTALTEDRTLENTGVDS